MAKPSKAAAIFLFLFGLPFFGVGLFFALGSLFAFPSVHRSGSPIAGAAFGLAFALVGLGLMFAAVYGYQKLKQDAATRDTQPNSPWLWRSDWATGQALSEKRNSVVGWWIGTLFTGMIIVPIAANVTPGAFRTSDPKALIPLGLCIIPATLLIGAVRASIRRERYGKTNFQFGSLPFSPGKHVTGQINLLLDTSAEHGIDLRLACLRTIVTGQGKGESQSVIVIWEDKKNVPQGSLSIGPLGTAIPVDFGIPQDAYETSHENLHDQIAWILYAKADLPGVDYSDAFEIPVFHSGAGFSTSATGNNLSPELAYSNFGPSSRAAAATAPAFESDASEVPAPYNPRVVVSTTAEGATEFYFPPFRNRARTLVLLLFTALWTAIVYYLAHSRAPWFFAVVFGFFDLLLVYGCLQTVFGSTKIVVGNGKITSLRKIFGSWTSREIAFSDVQSVLATLGVQNSNASNASYTVRLQTKDGKNLSLADSIADRQEARWIVSQIEKLAGLKIDTHVSLQGPFGSAYGPPPQRLFSSNTPVTNNPKRSVVGALIGVAIILGWAGLIVYQFTRFHHTTSQLRSAAARPASRGVRIQPKYGALTDADEERLRQQPIQDQAEELLERTIQHDPRALELFEQNIQSPEWLGRIKLTPKMKDLERRSEYSSDLRVRYANADLNLSMDGWAKTDDSAELLIERARTDPHYRPAAVYFMGMLAGRGIAYDRLYPVLLDYAKNNSDPAVRQWAVEGMRYLGTDEALDQLFEIFVSDSSYRVRDRAGCNISDCGNFKRAQRMRMVPKFLELVADSATNSQMRNWGFMALHEITGENLPNDPSAWQNWYDQHGTEKLAQFEQADWWQVNGNE